MTGGTTDGSISRAGGGGPPAPPLAAGTDGVREPVLALTGIRRRFHAGGRRVQAVDDVSLTLARGEILGIVGESGSGKSTLGRIAVGLERADAGRIAIHGTDVTDLPPRARRPYLARCQMVFQDPFASLNPRLPVGFQVGEALRAQGGLGEAAVRARVAALFDRVGLTAAQIDRYPHEFSGGQRQRIAIARALAPGPEIVVADEPVSALDVTIRAQILALFAEVQREAGLSYLFISHDIAVVAHLADRIAVMTRGRIVEIGDTARVIGAPEHPYTRTLIDAVPRLGRRRTGTVRAG